MSSNEEIKISIVTVSLNCATTIEKTILSVLNQTYKNIEYVVIDGMSTDGTLDILKNYEGRIAKVISEKDTGIYNAMNKGIKITFGEYIYFLNSDDLFFDQQVVEKVVDKIKAHRDIDLFYGDVIAQRGEEVIQCNSPKVLNRKALCRDSFCHQAIFARRNALLATQGFDESYRVAADIDWLTKSLTQGCKALHVGQNIAVVSLEGLSGSLNWRHEKKRFLKSNFTPFERLFWRKIPKLLKIK